jgi:hypothetical protein
VHGQNPYLVPIPSSTEVFQQLQPGRELVGTGAYTSPYGPVWTSLSFGLARLTADQQPLTQVFVYRLLGSAAIFGCMALLWRLLQRPGFSNVERSLALLVLAWNPLVLFEVVANGHNDGFMVMLVLAGLVLLASPARFAVLGAVAAFALAALVKFLPLVLVLFTTAAMLRGRVGLRARGMALLVTCATLTILVAVLAAPWFDARRPAAMLSSALEGGGTYVNVIWDLPTSWIASRWIDRGGQHIAAAHEAVRSWPQTVVRILFLAYVAFELRRLWSMRRLASSAERTEAIAEAWVRTTLLGLLLAFNQVLAWYYVWPVAVAAVLGWRSYLCRLTVVYSLLYLLLFYAIRADLVRDRGPWLVLYELGPLVWLALMSRRGGLRRVYSGAPAATPVR